MKKGTIAKTLAVLATLSLSSCSNPFFGGNEEFMITDIATRVDAATGDTIVTITFSDEEKEPLVLTIPQGVSGKDGVSRFIGAWAPVMFFVTCGFNHSIADMTYCTMGLFAKTVPAYVETAQALGADLSALTWGNYFVGNMLPVTLGNILGGLFVGFTMWFGFLRKAK